jgi:hypothetical protein
MSDNSILIPSEIIENKIFIIRGKKVMLDKDLAQLYGVETKQLKRAVTRNIERFPVDFMFELTNAEDDSLRCQIGTLKRGKHSKYLPFVFTEYGILMLSSVLNSKRAIQVNIQIMRIFTKFREMLMNYKDLQKKIDAMENKYDGQFKNVFEAIKLLIQNDQQINRRFSEEETKRKNKQYGFRPN